MSDVAIVLRRKAREDGMDWLAPESWLGGLPILGERPWPRGVSGAAMHFLAQVSLPAVHATAPKPIPQEGWLAFFVDCDDQIDELGCAVVHVSGSARERTQPPEDKAPVYADGWRSWSIFYPGSPEAPRSFPHWPVSLHAVEAPVQEDVCERSRLMTEAVQRALGNADSSFYAERVYEQGSLGDPPVFWETAQRFVTQVEAAVSAKFVEGIETWSKVIAAAQRNLETGWRPEDKGLLIPGIFGPEGSMQKKLDFIRRSEAGLAEAREVAPNYKAFLAELREWVADRDPWTEMRADQVDHLEAQFARLGADYEKLPGYMIETHQRWLAKATWVRMATHPDERVWRQLPDRAREVLNSEHLMPTDRCHQMFGTGAYMQNAVWENADKTMLMQLVYDDMMLWMFGDVGAYQFWIDPEDLAAARWDKVNVTFEAH